jgi:hypothetical protein
MGQEKDISDIPGHSFGLIAEKLRVASPRKAGY